MPDSLPSAHHRHRIAFRTLGCKLNQCETAQMEQAAEAVGYLTVGWEEPADVRVVNTCSVTAKTDRTCRREIRRARRLDPRCRLIVTGCYAQIVPDQVAAIPGVDLVLGNTDKLELGRRLKEMEGVASDLDECERRARIEVTPYSRGMSFRGDFIRHFSGYTRAFLKIQNGCDSRCSYCIIPTARGHSRSMRLTDVLEQVRLLGEQGYQEVVLTGIHLGAWGRDTGEGALADLLQEVLGVDSVGRFRLSSIEPLELDDRLLAVAEAAGPRIADHFHLPLQSGSDSVLRRMNRTYRSGAYRERVRAVRDVFPDAAIGADVIVGFPGETDEEFEETYALVEELPLTYVHVFSYSDRPGTRASSMESKVRPEMIEERGARLRALSAEKDGVFRERFRGRELQALVLRQRADDGRLVALTGNYLEVLVEGADEMKNTFVWVRLDRRCVDGLWRGTIMPPADRPPVGATRVRAAG